MYQRHLLSAAIAVSLCFAWAGLAIAQVGWSEFVTTVHREASQHLFVGDHAETIRAAGGDHDILLAVASLIGHRMRVGADARACQPADGPYAGPSRRADPRG